MNIFFLYNTFKVSIIIVKPNCNLPFISYVSILNFSIDFHRHYLVGMWKTLQCFSNRVFHISIRIHVELNYYFGKIAFLILMYILTQVKMLNASNCNKALLDFEQHTSQEVRRLIFLHNLNL